MVTLWPAVRFLFFAAISLGVTSSSVLAVFVITVSEVELVT